MILLRAAGLLVLPTAEEIQASGAWPPLLARARAWMAAGVVLTPSDMVGLTEPELAALAQARREIRAEDAAATGLAAQGVAMAAAVLAPADGSTALTDLTLQAAAARAAKRLQGSTPA
jgi:hypothetical protein